MEAHPLKLTLNEAVYLDDILAPMPYWSDELTGALGGLQDAINAAFLAAHQTGHETEIAVTLAELWILQDYTKSHVRVGGEMVGMNLKVKVAEGLAAFRVADEIDYASDLAAGIKPLVKKEPRKKRKYYHYGTPKQEAT